MVEMNVTFSEKIKEYIEQQTALEGYSTPSDYLEKLINEEQRRNSAERTEQLLLEGLQSEPIVTTPSEFLAQQRARLEDRVRLGIVRSVNP